MAYRLLHKKSDVSGNTPEPEQLKYGELAINYNAESPQLYIKNSNDNIVNFIDENKINNVISDKIDNAISAQTENISNEINKKQDNLISGENIKTINDISILGSGNINIKKYINDNILIPIYSNPNLDFDSTSNNVNCHGYVGTFQNIKVNGDLILIDSIGVYVREGNASPNLDTSVWCRLLKFVNDTWEILYQSVESKTISGIAPETLFSFKMKAVNEQNKLIKSTDKIAIVYANAEDADALSSVQLGFKSISVPGGLLYALQNDSPGVSNWAPAFVIGYLSMSDTPKNVVTIENSQIITGTKQFNDGINISGKSFITSAIDPGELKVLHNNSYKGFIIRTRNTSDSILPLEILTTNGSASYQYNFPSTGGTVAMISDVNNVKSSTKIFVNDSLANALKFDAIESGTKTFELSSPMSNFKVVYLSDMKRFAAKSLELTNPKYYLSWSSYNDYPSSNSYQSHSLMDETKVYEPIVGKFYIYLGDLCVWDGNEFQVKFYSKERVDLEINNLKEKIYENEEIVTKTLININNRLKEIENI